MDGSHGRFLWYELMTTDVAAAKAFYADVFGWGTQDASMPDSAYVLFTVGEAAMRMDLAEAPVLLFRNRSHGELNLVYRRTDGNIGWIDPELDATRRTASRARRRE